MTLAGVDGCPDGWLCVTQRGTVFDAFVAENIGAVLARVGPLSVVAIDIPIGLTERGSRSCDLLVRKLLGQPRGSSVFPAPVRAVLNATTYADACERHVCADGRKISQQTFAICGKIREVDLALTGMPQRQHALREIHPEVSFALWNGGQAMVHRKSRSAGRGEREQLIESHWPGLRTRLKQQLGDACYEPDDLNDALAALWTAGRIHAGTATSFPTLPVHDRVGLPMNIWA